MRGEATILINRLPTVVFDFIVDPRKAAYWHTHVVRHEVLSQTPDPVGRQTRWVFGGSGFEVEAIETIVAHERPMLFASRHNLIQFLRGPAPQHGQAPMTREMLDQQFRMAYGAGTPGGLLAVEITPHGEDAAQVTMRVESDIRGTARISSWFGRLMGRSPLRQNLAALKDRIESET